MHRAPRPSTLSLSLLLLALLGLGGCEEGGSNAFAPKLDVTGDTALPPSDTAAPDTSGGPKGAQDVVERVHEELGRGEHRDLGTVVVGKLKSALEEALGQLSRGDLCDAASSLAAATDALRAAEDDGAWTSTALTVRLQRARLELAAAASTPCAGLEGLGDPVSVKANEPTARRAGARVTFPILSWRPERVRERLFARIDAAEGAGTLDVLGRPDVPVVRSLVAMPIGATPRLTVRGVRKRQVLRANVAPVQEPAAVAEEDATWFPQPEPVYDPARYGASGLWPTEPCDLAAAGSYRDTPLVIVTCAMAQVDLGRQEVTLYSELEWEVTFEGGSGAYELDVTVAGFEDGAHIRDVVINGGILGEVAPLKWEVVLPPDPDQLVADAICAEGEQGESLLIIAPEEHAEGAEAIASLRTDYGLPATAILIPKGLSVAQIDAIIEARYTTCPLRPSYVLLLGDSDTIPAARVPRDYESDHIYAETWDTEQGIATDAPYAHIGPVELMPDLMVGRLPVKTKDQLNAVVDAIHANQEVALEAPQWHFDRVLLAGGFECCDDDEDVAEGTEDHRFTQIARPILRWLGRTPAIDGRVLFTQDKRNEDYEGDETPRYSNDGVTLVSPLGPDDGLDWGAGSLDAQEALVAQPSVVMYFNHGGTRGWANPPLNVSDLWDYAAPQFPPFFIDFTCNNGMFDNEQSPPALGKETSDLQFGEALVRQGDNGGVRAIGVLANTRIVFSRYMRPLIHGAADAIFPDLLASAGPTTPVERAGQVARRAYARLIELASPRPGDIVTGLPGRSTSRFYDTFYATVLLGDPTALLPREALELLDPAGLPAEVVRPPESIEPVAYTSGWWDEVEPLTGLPWPEGPEEVDPLDHDFSATEPVIVDWASGGLTVLGGPEGSRVVVVRAVWSDGGARERVDWLGTATVAGARADVSFFTGSAGTAAGYPGLTAVYLISPAGARYDLRVINNEIVPLVGPADLEPVGSVEDFDDLPLGPIEDASVQAVGLFSDITATVEAAPGGGRHLRVDTTSTGSGPTAVSISIRPPATGEWTAGGARLTPLAPLTEPVEVQLNVGGSYVSDLFFPEELASGGIFLGFVADQDITDFIIRTWVDTDDGVAFAIDDVLWRE